MKSGTAGRPVSLSLVVAALSAGILFYSQQTTLDWDEGFHLVAASLINAGRRPYIDFCFPQPPVHAYWNAFWLRILGDSWRGPHAVAALLTCATVALVAELVYRRTASQIQAGVAALFVGLNAIVVEFGTKAQAYGAGLFLTFAAFRLTVAEPSLMRSALAGCIAGASADCTLLTAPACVVLFAWTAWRRRLAHAAAFAAGAVIGLLPVLMALIRSPYLAWFNLVGYHVFFRRAGWTGAAEQDFSVLAGWVNSGAALLLGLFAVAGFAFVRKREFYLAGAMAVAMALEAATAHPTFSQYFIFLVPLLAVPAAAGVIEVSARLSMRPAWAVAGLAVLFGLNLANALVATAGNNNDWDTIANLAKKVKQVTPADATVLADPPVYFAMRQIPPEGSNFPASHRMEVPPAEAARLHIVPQSQLERQVKAGEFATVETCRGDEDEIEALELHKHYAQSESINDCQVYWGFHR